MMTRIERYLAAYDHVLRILHINNDNYFKRTQILMIVAQSAVFIVFAKLLTLDTSKVLKVLEACPFLAQHWPLFLRMLLLIVSSLGIAAGFLWRGFANRQHDVIEFCRTYLRGIESPLMNLDVPLGYFTCEQRIFYRDRPEDKQLYVHFRKNRAKFAYYFTDREDRRMPPDRICERFPHPHENSDKPGRLARALARLKRSKDREKKFEIRLPRAERKILPYVFIITWGFIALVLFSILIYSLVCHFRAGTPEVPAIDPHGIRVLLLFHLPAPCQKDPLI